MHEYEGKVVIYFRVGVARQAKSGIGLEVQWKRVLDYLNGSRREVVAEFTEFESGWKYHRPELEKAFAACRGHDATLIVAELGRIFCNPALTITLMASRVTFVALDNPRVNSLNNYILATVAEYLR